MPTAHAQPLRYIAMSQESTYFKKTEYTFGAHCILTKNILKDGTRTRILINSNPDIR
jgi:hypothetical protein